MKFWIPIIAQFFIAQAAYGLGPADTFWTTEQALRRFADDYEKDASAIAPLTFGIEVDGERFLVRAISVDGSTAVHLSEGFGNEPTFFFKTDRETLAKIDAGALHGLTAMAQTRAGDPAPMTLEFMEAFAPDNQAAFQSTFLSVAFHFWTRAMPESVMLDQSASRVVHGAHAVAIFYDPDLHSAWYHVKQGQHVNADPRDQINDHPSLFIFTGGTGRARIGGIERTVAASEAVHVPKGIPHEFWNPNQAPLEFIILMWGFDN